MKGQDVAYWREQVRKCIALAQELSRQEDRDEMLRIAESYDRLAKLAELHRDKKGEE